MLRSFPPDPVEYHRTLAIMKDYRVGALLMCGGERYDPAAIRQLLTDFTFTETTSKISYGACDAYYK